MIHLKARHWFLFFAAAVLALALVLTGRIYRDAAARSASAQGQDYAPQSRVIIIDPGHGGFDGGAVAADGTVEKNINLAISLKLRDMLRLAGFDVVMTRDTDTATNENDSGTIRQKKISDMRSRLNLTKLYPGSTLVSIHQNKLVGSSSTFGGQIFYSPNRPESKALAQCIQDEFNATVQPQKPREIVRTGKNLYLFYHAQNTAVLCECGFLSNPQETALLNTEEYQYKIAGCIYAGLLRFREGAYNAS